MNTAEKIVLLWIVLSAFAALSVILAAKHHSIKSKRNYCKYGNVKAGSSIKVYENDRK